MKPIVSIVAMALLVAASSAAQVNRPRDFAEYRGAWILDEGASAGRIAGLPVAKRLTIETTPTEIKVTRDELPSEIYKVDGREVPLVDERTGVALSRTHEFAMVAGMMVLTSTNTRPTAGGPAAAGSGERTLTTIVADAYTVIGDQLTVDRQMTSLARPEGHLVTLANVANNQMSMVYRRSK